MVNSGHRSRSTDNPVAPPQNNYGTLLRVLFVDDNDNDCLLSISALKRAGYRVDPLRVDNASDLRGALEHRSWDIVLADFNLQKIDGPSALRIVKHYNPDTPFILLSDGISADHAAATIAAGANNAVSKNHLTRLPPIVERELRLAGERIEEHRSSLRAKATAAALEESESRFMHLAENIPECFWLFDVALRQIVFVNAAFEQIWGEPLAELYRNPDLWWQKTHPDDAPRIREAIERARFGGLDEQLQIVRPDGTIRWVHLRTFPIRDNAFIIRSIGGVASDITRNIEQQMQVQQLAHFDSLTALPNRLLFQERLSSAVALSRRNDWRLAVVFVDLDRFKNVNDTLGHKIGDELLRLVSIRLKSCLRDSDTVGRLGGDEFAIILPDLESSDVAAIVAKKIIGAVEQPFLIADEEIYISASIGITLFPEDAEDIETLIRNADTAMYRAKESGRNNYQFYTAEMNRRTRQRLALENNLRRALARHQFELHYQPKVSCSTCEIIGFEALLRWRNPDRGLIPPSEFVPMLEETGLIVEVGDWVLNEACRQTQAWHASGAGTPIVGVNVSGIQLECVGFAESVRKALARSGLPAKFLELELTESVLMRDASAVVSILVELKEMGISLSVDDFGTGYSSLAYLKRFPLDCLKVDRSFVQDITADADDASITRAIINMAHELALDVVAEGVETEGQLQMLLDHRCDHIQGYYFSHPLTASEMGAMLRAGHSLDLGSLRIPPSDNRGYPPTTTDNNQPQRRAEQIERELREEFSREQEKWRGHYSASHGLQHEILGNIKTPLLGIANDGLIAFANIAAEKLLADYMPLVGMEISTTLPHSLYTLISTQEAVDTEMVVGANKIRVRARSIGTRKSAHGRVLAFEVLDTSEGKK